MPRFDGTGPRGEGMFTGRGEGYCVLRWPKPGCGEPVAGYAGIEGRPMQFAPGLQEAPADVGAGVIMKRRLRCARRRCVWATRRSTGT